MKVDIPDNTVKMILIDNKGKKTDYIAKKTMEMVPEKTDNVTPYGDYYNDPEDV